MAKDWKEISDDDLLNFDGANTGQMAKYERIMQKRSQEALHQTQKEIWNLSSRIDTSTDRLVGVGNKLIQKIEEDAKSQERHQKAIVWLTIVIAIATVFYTGITWLSVQAMHESNELQRQILESNGPHVTSGPRLGTVQSAAP